MVKVVIRDLTPKEFGKLQEIKKREGHRTWKGLIKERILKDEEDTPD